jgi:hypothetical protein
MSKGNMVSAAQSTYTHSGRPVPRKRKQDKKRTPKWTKSPRFPGQATFDLANDLNKVPFAKSAYKRLEVDVIGEDASTDVSLCTSCGVTTQACSCDPLMKELDDMEKNARMQGSATISSSLPAAQTGGLIPRDRFPSLFGSSSVNTRNVSANPGAETFTSPPPAPLFDSSINQEPTMLLQPEAGPITQEQLINEVRGIYAGLVMVEKKCIEIDLQEASSKDELSDEEWQALIGLHRTLLLEHYDFVLATHHPLASPALRGLAGKFGMTSRMWEHGINGFLKSIRHHMPGMAEKMLAYLDFAYSVLEYLSVHLPSLAPEWVECIKGLNIYYGELQRILQAGPSSWHWCTSCMSEGTSDCAALSLNPAYTEHQHQASTPSNTGTVGPVSYPNVVFGALDGCGDLQSNWEATANSSSSSSSTTAGQDVYAAKFHDMPDASMPRRHWRTTLSEVACLVLAGWLWVGQGSSLDFNIFVKVFCILAMSDLM